MRPKIVNGIVVEDIRKGEEVIVILGPDLTPYIREALAESKPMSLCVDRKPQPEFTSYDPFVMGTAEREEVCPDYDHEGKLCLGDGKTCPFHGNEAKCGEKL